MYSFSFGLFVTDVENRQISPKRLEGLVDELRHVMIDCENELGFDVSVGAKLAAGEVDIDLVVAAERERTAAPLARDFVIEAIKKTGGTPIGLWVFPPTNPRKTPRRDWHERKAEMSTI
jgi:hypothetical protein